MEKLSLIERCNTMRGGFQPWVDDLTFTLNEKRQRADDLKELGVHYIEGNWPYSLPVLSDDPIQSGFMIAIFLSITTFIIPVFSCELRKNKSVLFGYWFVIALHQIMAFTNACLYQCWIVRRDANGFHSFARELAQYGEWHYSIGADFYVHLLGAVYRWLGPSHLLGEQLSILAFAFSCIIFLKIIPLLGVDRYKLFSLLAFGALPSMVLYGSITLRESYQVFFFILAVYSGLKMCVKGVANIHVVSLILSAWGMAQFHGALNLYMAFLVVLFVAGVLLPATPSTNIWKTRLATWMIIPILLAVMVVVSKTSFSNLWEAISLYRQGGIATSGRTTYGVPFDISSPIMAIYSIFRLYVYYLFTPFPWQVTNIADLYSAMESILRMVLIYFSVKRWLNAYGMQRRLLGLMLILYFSMTFFWAIGTTNYGTAMRHHLMSWGILTIVGIPSLLEKLERIRHSPN